VFVAVNSVLRRRRRRVAVLAAVIALAGAVVTVHSVATHDHLGDAAVMCLAVAETAVAAAGAALLLSSRRLGLPRPVTPVPRLKFAATHSAPAPWARAGPPRLQVFRL
jgi:drug/metabolite transporter (DMT)-like permease